MLSVCRNCSVFCHTITDDKKSFYYINTRKKFQKHRSLRSRQPKGWTGWRICSRRPITKDMRWKTWATSVRSSWNIPLAATSETWCQPHKNTFSSPPMPLHNKPKRLHLSSLFKLFKYCEYCQILPKWFTANARLAWKNLTRANALAYFATVLVKKKKS